MTSCSDWTSTRATWVSMRLRSVFDAALAGVARAHAIAAVIEDTADQQGLGLHPCGFVTVHLFAQLGLDGLEQVAIDNGRLLALEAERFFTDFDIKILRSVKAASRRTTEAPPRPSGRRGRISERPQRPELTTLPLQSRLNASPFWIMLLLSLASLEHSVISMGAHRLIEVHPVHSY